MIGYSPKFDSKQNLDGIQIEFTIIRHQILFFFSLYHEDEQVFQISLVIDPQKKFQRSQFSDEATLLTPPAIRITRCKKFYICKTFELKIPGKETLH